MCSALGALLAGAENAATLDDDLVAEAANDALAEARGAVVTLDAVLTLLAAHWRVLCAWIAELPEDVPDAAVLKYAASEARGEIGRAMLRHWASMELATRPGKTGPDRTT